MNWLQRLRADGSATHLGVVRIVFGLHLLTVFTSPALELIAATRIPPHPLARTVFPDVLGGLITPELGLVLQLTGIIAVLLMIIGLASRLSVVVVTVCFLGTQFLWFRHSVFHDDWLYFGFDLLVLCFARVGDALSLDALIARRRGRPLAPPQAYRWPIELMIFWFAFVYVSAGLAKLLPLRKGLLWLDGSSAQAFAAEFVADGPIYWLLGGQVPFDYTVRWPWMMASVGTVVVELGMVVLLLTPRAYLPALVAVLGMHVGIFMLGIPGFVQVALAHCVLFLPVARLMRLDRRGGT